MNVSFRLLLFLSKSGSPAAAVSRRVENERSRGESEELKEAGTDRQSRRLLLLLDESGTEAGSGRGFNFSAAAGSASRVGGRRKKTNEFRRLGLFCLDG
ncbi:unnamed protein product [Linum trigynum]|uniref:Secreted protein n=1 Tax=Linum trigynum TaxID=586398 RepID=A0AAV2CDR6_9ROSI